jgi:hypothetical protein
MKIEFNWVSIKSDGVLIEDSSNWLVSIFNPNGKEIISLLHFDLTRPVARFLQQESQFRDQIEVILEYSTGEVSKVALLKKIYLDFKANQ